MGMRQIIGGCVYSKNERGNYIIHLPTATKVEFQILIPEQKEISMLVVFDITERELEQCRELGLSESEIKKLKKKSKCLNENFNGNEDNELVDYNRNVLVGINEIAYVMHKYYFPRAIKIECSAWIGEEVYNYSIKYSK